MSTIHAAQLDPFALSGAGASLGDTSITLKSFQTIDGVNLAMSDFGSIGFGTLDPGNGALEEQISFTGVVQNSNGTATLSGISSVTFLTPYTATSGLAKTHAGSTTFVISNTSGFYNNIPFKQNDETITGQWTFSVFPITPSVPVATDSVSGTAKLSLVSDTPAAPVVVGTNDPRLVNAYAASSAGTDAYAITVAPAPAAYVAGQIYSFKADVANTAGATLQVNSLAAIAINNSSGNALVTGDILAGQIVVVEYDGTAFQIVSDRGTKFGGNGTDGALSISSGTTTIDLASATVVIKNYTSISITGTGALAFSNPNSAGTIVILKSQGNVTITSSATPTIDLRSIGAAGGTGVEGSPGNSGTSPTGLLAPSVAPQGVGGSTTTGAVAGASMATLLYLRTAADLYRKSISLVCGAGGGAGNGGSGGSAGAGGAGGRGGGALYIECGGALNFTGVINSSGTDGSAGSAAAGTDAAVGAGGGGSAGTVVILYNTLTANSGTVTSTGGAGGTAPSGAGTTGSAGGGGSGAGSINAAGGAGGNGAASPTAGAAGGGTGAGGGGGGGKDGSGASGAGGAAGASMGGLITPNTEFN